MRPSRKHDELRELVRGAGLRATPSRLAVLELLINRDQPLSHNEVSDGLSAQGWDPVTLYRNLIDLADAGLVRRTDMGDHTWRFELVSDEHPATHPHFICTECGTVECLPLIELVVPRAKTPRSVRKHQFELQLRGLCDACG